MYAVGSTKEPCYERPNLLLLYDIVRRRERGVGLSMTTATPLIAGMGEVLGEWPAVAGAGLLGAGSGLRGLGVAGTGGA